MKKALFAGSFNPLHQGHIKVIEKALDIFDFLYVVITLNPDKKDNSNFNIRFSQVQENLKHWNNVEVLLNQNKMTAHLAKELNCKYLIRSARDNFDFEYELELAAGNKSINPELETIVFFPDFDNINYRSTLIRHQKYFKKEQ